MIIDFHTHIFPDVIAERAINGLQKNSSNIAYSDGTAEGLVFSLKKANADIGIALPVLTKPSQFESVLDFAILINEKYKNQSPRILSFCGLHPDCDNIEEKIIKAKTSGIKGIKIHPDFQNTFIDDEKYLKIIDIADKNGMIVITHSGVDDGYKDFPVRCTPDRILNVLNITKPKKFVLAHYGAHRMWEETLEKLAGKDIFFDTAFTLNDINEKLFKEILNKHGDDKILFATDSPWRDIKEDVDILKSFNLSKETEEKILYKNAINLLGI